MSSLLFILINPFLRVRQLEPKKHQMCHQHIELIIVFLIAKLLRRTLCPDGKRKNVNFDRTRDNRTG